MHNIGLLLILALLTLAWWNTLGARNAARAAARRACREAGVAFIDEIALRRLGFGRGEQGQFCIKRVYGFEFFVSGERRYAGEVEMHARRIASVHMDPYPF